MKLSMFDLVFFVWFIFLLVWKHIAISISKETINILCGVIIVIDICLFLLTIKLFKVWLLVFYIVVGMFFLREKFGRWTESAYIRRESVSSMQDCIVITGTLMIVVSLTFLSIIR